MGRRAGWSRLVVAAMTAAAVGSAVAAAPASAAVESQTSLTWTSQPGDFVGQGRSGSTSDASTFRVSGSAGRLSVSIAAGATESWTIDLAAPEGQQLTTGRYDNVTRAPFNSTAAGLSVSSGGRGCNATKGWFTIFALTADSRGTVTSLDAAFTQFCDAGTGALSGTVKVAAPYVVPIVLTGSTGRTVLGQDLTLTARVAPGTSGGPVFYDGATPLGQGTVDANGLARFTTTQLGVGPHDLYARVNGAQSARLQHVVADNATSWWFRSDNGDFIGQGATASHLPSDSELTVSGTTSAASLTVRGLGTTDYWRAEFAAPAGQTLQAGRSYPGAVRATSRTGDQPGLDVSGNGRGCNTLTGEFTVHSLESAPDGTVQAMEVSFVQRCGASTSRMAGWARYAPGRTAEVSTTAVTTSATGPLTATVTAVVSGGTSTPTGRVVVDEAGTTLGSGLLDGTGRATVSVTLSRGTHVLTATYTGDPAHQPSRASSSVSLAGYTSSTTVTSTVTGPLTATLTAAVGSPDGPAVPTGPVTFTEGATTLGTVVLDASGRASLPVTLTRGAHTVTVGYGGSSTVAPSGGSTQLSLAGSPTTTSVVAPRTAKLGKPVQVTVTVAAGSGQPTGTVRLYDGVEPVASTVTLVGGRATITWTPTAKGTRTLTVRYAGDGTFAPSTSAVASVKVT